MVRPFTTINTTSHVKQGKDKLTIVLRQEKKTNHKFTRFKVGRLVIVIILYSI